MEQFEIIFKEYFKVSQIERTENNLQSIKDKLKQLQKELSKIKIDSKIENIFLLWTKSNLSAQIKKDLEEINEMIIPEKATKKVICINNYSHEKVLQIGKVYNVEDEESESDYWIKRNWIPKDRFIEVKE